MSETQDEQVYKVCKYVLFGYLQYISVEHSECNEDFTIPTCEEVLSDPEIKSGVIHFLVKGRVTKMLAALEALCVRKDPSNCRRLLNKDIFKLWYMERHQEYKKK